MPPIPHESTAPHENPAVSPVTIRTGAHWIPGDLVSTPFGTVQRGPLYALWLTPAEVTQRYPVILVHGGGGQGTDFLTTPDGRPGWAYDLVADGFAVYVVDRPGHGRSPHHPDVLGPCAPPFSLEAGAAFFTPPDHERHTQWPGERGAEDPEFAQLAASFGFLMADLAEAQELDGRRLAALLDLTGPAILITHSAGAPGGWLAANQRPDLVVGIIAVEPMGPPFAELPGPGEMTWGLSYGKPVTAPPTDDPSELKADPGRFAIPGLTDHPILVVAGDVSISAAGARPTVEFLDAVGANAELLDLPEVGIHGNSHGLVFERNSRQISALLVDWIQRLEAT